MMRIQFLLFLLASLPVEVVMATEYADYTYESGSASSRARERRVIRNYGGCMYEFVTAKSDHHVLFETSSDDGFLRIKGGPVELAVPMVDRLPATWNESGVEYTYIGTDALRIASADIPTDVIVANYGPSTRNVCYVHRQLGLLRFRFGLFGQDFLVRSVPKKSIFACNR